MTDMADPGGDRDLRAAELALGLLTGEARAHAERELLRDPAFRASHAYWQALSGQWLENVPPLDGGADLLPAIEAAIDADKAGGEVSRSSAPSVSPTHPKGLRVWAIAATIVALASLVTSIMLYQRDLAARRDNAALTQRLARSEGERRVAQITGEENRVLVSALYNPASGTIDLKLGLPNAPDRVPELWVIPGDGRPRSLGIFRSTTAQLQVKPALRPMLIDGAALAVTMEPAHGAPHAAPSGPVLGVTELRAI